MTSLSNTPDSLTGFSKLPRDLLLDLIERYVDINQDNYRHEYGEEYQRDAIRISNVNRKIREAALSFPSLWSTVSIDDRPSALKIARLFAERAGALGHKLDLTVWIRGNITQHQWIALLQCVEDCTPDLKALRMVDFFAGFQPNSHVLEPDMHTMLAKLNAPHLVKLDISFRIDDRPPNIPLHLPKLPCLRQLKTCYVSFDRDSAPFRTLTSLTVACMRPGPMLATNSDLTLWDDFNGILSQAPLLQQLKFNCIDYRSADGHPLPALLFPELKELDITMPWNDMAMFLARLDAPALTTVDLNFRYDFRDEGHAIPAHPSVTTCRTSYADWDPGTRLSHLEYGALLGAMARLLQAFPTTSILRFPFDLIPILLDHPHIGTNPANLIVSPPVSYPPTFDHRNAFYDFIGSKKLHPSSLEWIEVLDLSGLDRGYGSMDWMDCDWE